MSYKTLLVHAEPDWGSSEGLIVARHLAEMFGAHILGVAGESFELPSYSYADGEAVQMIRDSIDKDLATAKTRFEAAMADAPQGSTFVSAMERPAVLIKQHAGGADLIVARRTPRDASVTNLCHPADLILGAGGPVLLAPEGAAPLEARRVVVAWKDRPEARRALADALPFLKRAEKVVLAAVCPHDARRETHDSLREVAARLTRHGVKTDIHVSLPSSHSVTADIEDEARKWDADLVVVGAYSHSRMNEWVLGGVTQDLLFDFKRYILFSH